MKTVFYLLFSISAVCPFPFGLRAQSESWDDSGLSRHAVVTINVNVPRLLESNRENLLLEKFTQYWLARRHLELNKLDQVQMVFSNDPELELGPDSSSNLKLVFAEPIEPDADMAGSLSGYKSHLASSDYKGNEIFVGEFSGYWGGMQSSDQALVIAVPRVLKSIIDSQGMGMSPAHDVAGLKKNDVDLCMTLSGGKSAQEFARIVFGTDHLAKALELTASGVVYLDTRSDRPLTATFQPTNGVKARELANELSSLIKSTRGLLGEHIKHIQEEFKEVAESMFDNAQLPWREQEIEAIQFAINLLESLDVTVENDTVVVRATTGEFVRELPTRLANWYLEQMH